MTFTTKMTEVTCPMCSACMESAMKDYEEKDGDISS